MATKNKKLIISLIIVTLLGFGLFAYVYLLNLNNRNFKQTINEVPEPDESSLVDDQSTTVVPSSTENTNGIDEPETTFSFLGRITALDATTATVRVLASRDSLQEDVISMKFGNCDVSSARDSRHAEYSISVSYSAKRGYVCDRLVVLPPSSF